MRVCVVGAMGAVGRSLVPLLLDRGSIWKRVLPTCERHGASARGPLLP